jgi:hypothetical protein
MNPVEDGKAIDITKAGELLVGETGPFDGGVVKRRHFSTYGSVGKARFDRAAPPGGDQLVSEH